MIARHIVSPSKVNAIYNKYVDGNYLTLMGCYPIGSDAERILIIAKKVAS
jgi:sortase (surface protein transpeptidase)